MNRTFNAIGKFVTVLCIAMAIWFCVSWAEVVSKNLSENPTYSKYNMFCLMLNYDGNR